MATGAASVIRPNTQVRPRLAQTLIIRRSILVIILMMGLLPCCKVFQPNPIQFSRPMTLCILPFQFLLSQYFFPSTHAPIIYCMGTSLILNLRLAPIRFLADIFSVKNFFEFSISIQGSVSQTILRTNVLVVPGVFQQLGLFFNYFFLMHAGGVLAATTGFFVLDFFSVVLDTDSTFLHPTVVHLLQLR